MERILTIGRNRGSDIPISEEYDTVGNDHARLGFEQNGTCYIIDNDSRNGTFVNEKKITSYEKYWLNKGDVISLAKVVKLDWEQYFSDRLTQKIGERKEK